MHSEAALYYEFKDKKGKTYKGRISVSWPRAEEILKREIKVVYIKSDPEINTLQSQRSLLWPLIFLGMFATLLTGSIVLLAKASMSDRKKEKENLLL
jgi:hypothetical protein